MSKTTPAIGSPYTYLPTSRQFNADFLITYLVHPGTAIYAGYNSNLENIAPGLCLHVAGSTQCDLNGSGLLLPIYFDLNEVLSAATAGNTINCLDYRLVSEN